MYFLLVLSPRSHMLLDPTGLIFPHLDSRTNRLVICSTEDNLIKGAGGQAIQSMNICEGFTETEGLL